MKNILVKLTIFISLLSSSIVLANDKFCISLTNSGDSSLEFSGLVDPGYTYTVEPGNSATLSPDHMAGACIRPDKNDCVVSILILDGTYQHYEIIDHLSPGTRIIYSKLHEYVIDKNANVRCGGQIW